MKDKVFRACDSEYEMKRTTYPEKPIPATVPGTTPDLKTCRYQPEQCCTIPIEEDCDPQCNVYQKGDVGG
jgi:hypothetical protein